MVSAFQAGPDGNPGRLSRADCPELRSVPLILNWDKLEPTAGRIRIRQVHRQVRCVRRLKDDLYVTLMIWVRPGTPECGFSTWAFRRSTRIVRSIRSADKMSKEDNLHPYYLHPEYKKRFFALIDAFGDYVNDLPPELRKRIVFVQSAEGSTGDGQPYKGNPLEKQYVISKDAWNAYRKETWIRYQKAVPGIPILVNSDANTPEETKWMLDNMKSIALKHGMFSHGYHVSDNNQRLEEFEAIEAAAKKRGIPVLTRGEMDGEMFVYALVDTQHPAGALLVGVVCHPLPTRYLEHPQQGTEGRSQPSRPQVLQQVRRPSRSGNFTACLLRPA